MDFANTDPAAVILWYYVCNLYAWFVCIGFAPTDEALNQEEGYTGVMEMEIEMPGGQVGVHTL